MKKYDNYCSALEVLAQASDQDLGNTFIQSGVIDKFFVQFELGWKLIKAVLAYEGDPVSQTGSPRDVLKTAFQYFSFMDDELWLEMLRDRNNAAHVYDENSAKRLVDKVVKSYIPEFERLRDGLQEHYGAPLADD